MWESLPGTHQEAKKGQVFSMNHTVHTDKWARDAAQIQAPRHRPPRLGCQACSLDPFMNPDSRCRYEWGRWGEVLSPGPDVDESQWGFLVGGGGGRKDASRNIFPHAGLGKAAESSLWGRCQGLHAGYRGKMWAGGCLNRRTWDRPQDPGHPLH